MKEACWACDSSNCVTKTGCAAVKNGKIILRAWNVILDEDISKVGTDLPERDYSVHAEANLVAKAEKEEVPLDGVVLYSVRYPCLDCARLIYQAGIKEIYYMFDMYTLGNVAEGFFTEVGIPVWQISESEVWG